ncbi:testis anion transporter 1 [Microcaecilia unicolor]|uniref:Testis anion transporter 1 n=1 Tax=Microcaecilia unicolor TaxID=1415580 RepID=A0A6P7ZVC2_9AMPH|nr:testis anion transporter 1 [Microcaecilia unicolor]
MKDQCDIMEQSPEIPAVKTNVYKVIRDVYSEEKFESAHPKSPPFQKNIKSTLKAYFSFPQKRFLDGLYKALPFLYWIRRYRIKSWLLGDLFSGINTGIVQIPQEMAATMAMKTPPINGICSAFINSVIYTLLGTSRHICLGSYSSLNVMMSNIQNQLHYEEHNNVSGYNYTSNELEAIALTATTTFLAGIIQVILGCFHVGILTAYLSETLMSAYLTAAAIFIMVSQFTMIFGIPLSFHTGPFALFKSIRSYISAIQESNSANTLIFLISMLLLWFSKCWKFSHKDVGIEFPMEFLLIFAFTYLSSKFELGDKYHINIAGMISIMPVAPIMPQFTSLHLVIFDAIALALVSYSILLCMGRLFAFKYGYGINSSQELIALGLCNIIGAFFRSFTISCTISRTIIQEKSGGSTQIAGLIATSLMLVVLMKAGHILWSLPQAVLSAIVFVNIQPLLESFRGIPDLWRQDKYDFAIWLCTFAACILLGLDLGLAVAIGFSILTVGIRTHRMKILTLGQIPKTNIYMSVAEYEEALEINGVKIFQCSTSIYFGNMETFQDMLVRMLAVDPEIIEECKIRALMKLDLSGCQGQEADNELSGCCNLCSKTDLQLTIPLAEYLRRRMPSENAVPGVNTPGTRSGLILRSNNQVDFTHPHLWPTAMANILESGEYREGPNRYLPSQYKSTPWLNKPGTSTPSSWSRNVSPVLPPSQLHGESSKAHPIHPFELKRSSQLHTIILDFTLVNFIDSEAARLLSEVWYTFEEIEIKILIAGCNPSVVHDLERNNFFNKNITKARLFLTVHDAVLFVLQRKEIATRRERSEDKKEEEGRVTPDVQYKEMVVHLSPMVRQRELEPYHTTFSYREHSN